jgi:transposase
MAKAGRKFSIDTHPEREQIAAEIIAAVVTGEKSLRVIANQYNLSVSSVQRYLKSRIAGKAAEEAAKRDPGKTLLDRIEAVIERLQKQYDAIDAELRDPEQSGRYFFGPKTWEIDVVHKTWNGKKWEYRKERLDKLLAKLDGSGYHPSEVLSRAGDPRDLINKTATALGKQLELIAKIQGMIKETVDNQFNFMIMIAKGKNNEPDGIGQTDPGTGEAGGRDHREEGEHYLAAPAEAGGGPFLPGL